MTRNKRASLLNRGSNCLMCEFALLEVEAMPTHREQLWTNRFLHRESPSTDPLSEFFFFFFFDFPPPQINPAERWQKFGTFKCLGEKSKYRRYCSSSPGTEYLEKLIWRSSRGVTTEASAFLWLLLISSFLNHNRFNLVTSETKCGHGWADCLQVLAQP